MNAKTHHCPITGSKLLHMVGVLPALLLVACATAPARDAPATNQEAIDSIGDPKAREVWQAAEDSGNLPPVSAVPRPSNPVTIRKPATVASEPRAPARPVIPDEAVVAVQAFSPSGVTAYSGPFEVTELRPGFMAGRMLEHDNSAVLEVHYRLPERRQLNAVRQGQVLDLVYSESLVRNSLHQRIGLVDAGTGRVPLLWLSEGGREPYRAELQQFSVHVAQQGGEGNPPVEVRFRDDVVTLEQGDSARIGRGERGVQVFLLNSYVVDQRYADADGGNPYHVMLVVYD